MRSFWSAFFAIGVALVGGAASAAPFGASDSAVVLMYHRFGEDEYPSTNTTLEQFEAHIAELTSGPYTVLPLEEVVSALRQGQPLPDRAVAITVDDAYLSVYNEAWPRLRDAGLPFTVFVSTGDVDRGPPLYMNWNHIRAMIAAGVTIGAHSESHGHYPTMDMAAIATDLDRSEAAFRREIGQNPALFAYPFGETSTNIRDLVGSRGYLAAFGQHSGVASRWDDLFYLPRFALNENYGDLNRVKLAVNALPIPVGAITPEDPLITVNNPPPMGFSLATPVDGIERISCYVSHVGKAKTELLGTERVEIRVDAAFPKGRTRLNCTVPASGDRWRWYGRQFFVP